MNPTMPGPDYESDDSERSIWSSKFDHTPDKMRERMNSAPPIPKVKKTRTQAVLTALPVIMLLVGLLFHWNGERKQTQGTPIEAQHQVLLGEFDRLTPRNEKQTGKHFLWFKAGERTRPIRVSYEQKQQLLNQSIEKGASVELKVAPTVEGSSVLWLMDLSIR